MDKLYYKMGIFFCFLLLILLTVALVDYNFIEKIPKKEIITFCSNGGKCVERNAVEFFENTTFLTIVIFAVIGMTMSTNYIDKKEIKQ